MTYQGPPNPQWQPQPQRQPAQYPPHVPQARPPAGGYGMPPQPSGYGYPAAFGYSPQPTAPNGAPLAEPSGRFLARLIDGLIEGGIAMVIATPLVVLGVIVLVNAANASAADGTATITAGDILLFILLELFVILAIFVITYVYEVEMTKRTGQTLGKRIMKIRVVPIQPNTGVSRGIMAKRWFLYAVVGAVVPGLQLIDALWLLWDKPYRQCLHDKFARTVVVKVPG